MTGADGKKHVIRWAAVCAFVAYAVALIAFVVFKRIPTIHVGRLHLRFAGTHAGPANLVPFHTIGLLVLGHGSHIIRAANLLGNILPFMPLGLLAPFVFKKHSWRTAIALGVSTGLALEVMELVFRVGIFDVDDVMLNALGVVLGYGVFRMLAPAPPLRQVDAA